MRTQIRRQQLPEGDLWRVCEADGLPVSRWLPSEPFLGCLDKGGYSLFEDALAFALGIDQIRADAGLFDPNVSRSIQVERNAQDEVRQGRPKANRHARILQFEAA